MFVYDRVALHVDLEVMPIQIRWTEWEEALGELLVFYVFFEPVQLLFSVHNSLGGTIARGFVRESSNQT